MAGLRAVPATGNFAGDARNGCHWVSIVAEMKWWDEYQLTQRYWARWRLGPLEFYAQPRGREWLFASKTVGDALEATLEIEARVDYEPDPEVYTASRYVTGDDSGRLKLSPRLPDRPMVVQPERPLFVLAGQEVVLFVTTVVWVAAVVEADLTLIEVPAQRPSDTWFGPNTLVGELCYASRTSARTDRSALTYMPHRAATPIAIRNHGVDTLWVEQLRVPLPALALYHDERNVLWTDAVQFVREHHDSQAALTIPGTSTLLPATREVIQPPRAPLAAGTIVQAFSRLLR